MDPIACDRGILYTKNGFLYKSSSIKKGVRYLMCNRTTCKSRASYRVKGKADLRVTPHNHPADEVDLEVLKFKTELRRVVLNDYRPARAIYSEVCLRFPRAARRVSYASTRSTIYRYRRRPGPNSIEGEFLAPIKSGPEAEPKRNVSGYKRRQRRKNDDTDEDEPIPKKTKGNSSNPLGNEGSGDCNFLSCCALACTNTSENNVLTCLPSDPERRDQWLSRINRVDWTPSEDSALCQIHFEEDAWEDNFLAEKVLKNDALPTLNLNGVFEGIRSWITFEDFGSIKDEHVRNNSDGELNLQTVSGDNSLFIKQEALDSNMDMMEETSGMKDHFEAVYFDSNIDKDDDDIITNSRMQVKRLNKSSETIVPEICHLDIKAEPVDGMDDQEQTSSTFYCPECNHEFTQKWDLEYHLKEKHPDSERSRRSTHKMDNSSCKLTEASESVSRSATGITVAKNPSSVHVTPSTNPCSCSHSTEGITQIVPLVSTSQPMPTIMAPPTFSTIGPHLVLFPQTTVTTQPVFLPLAGPSSMAAPSPPSPPPPTNSLPSCAVDSSETFFVSLAQFPASQRVVIKKKMLEVIEIVEKFKVKPETIVIAYKP